MQDETASSTTTTIVRENTSRQRERESHRLIDNRSRWMIQSGQWRRRRRNRERQCEEERQAKVSGAQRQPAARVRWKRVTVGWCAISEWLTLCSPESTRSAEPWWSARLVYLCTLYTELHYCKMSLLFINLIYSYKQFSTVT